MQDILIPERGWIHQPLGIQIPDAKRQSLLFQLTSKMSKILGRNDVPDIIKVLAVNSSLFWPWLHFASKLMPYGKLPARERELVILRVAWLCRCRYEWGQHIEIGQSKAKLSDQDVINISKGATVFESIQEQLLMRACDEIIRGKSIEASTWQALSEYYDDKILIEISLLIGHYEMLAGFLNSIGLQLESDIETTYRHFNQRAEIILTS